MRTTTVILIGLLLSASSARAQSAQSDHTAVTRAFRSLGQVEARSRMVERAFLRFSTVAAPEQLQNRLELLRDRDRLQWFGVGSPDWSHASYGAVLFAATTVLAAHAPGRLRAIFDGPVHLGPAAFEGGGLGVGIGGRFL